MSNITDKKHDEKMEAFKLRLRQAARDNSKEFLFDGEKYDVSTFNGFVQTLIDDRILFRIAIDESESNFANN